MGYILANVTNVDEDGISTTTIVCQKDKSGTVDVAQFYVAGMRQVICTPQQYLDSNFLCQPCDIQTPPLDQFSITWQWTTRSCVWECLADRLRYVDRLGHMHCLLWQDYQTVVITRADTWGKRFERVQHVIPHLSMMELGVFLVIMSSALAVQIFM